MTATTTINRSQTRFRAPQHADDGVPGAHRITVTATLVLLLTGCRR
ncbi:hypothetical protein [Actinoplanes sp. NPDC049802]